MYNKASNVGNRYFVDKVSQLISKQHMVNTRRPLSYEAQKLINFIRMNGLTSVQTGDESLIVSYRNREVLYIEWDYKYSRKLYVIYYDYKLANSIKLQGRHITTRQGMLVTEYDAFNQVADDLLLYMKSVYASFKPKRLKL